MTTGSALPIFSLKDLQNGLYKDELRACLREIGLFYITDTGIPESEHQLATNTTTEFFKHGKDEEKAALVTSIPGTRRGYSKLNSESTAQVTNQGSYSDYATCFSMGLDGNKFPSPEFENVWTNYFGMLFYASKSVARVVLAVSECTDGIESLIDCDPVLRIRDYPEVEDHRCAENVPLRMAPHYDLSIITLIHQTPAPNGFVGLQCKVDDKFVDVPPILDTLVVTCGAVATLVTDGQVKPAMHQVVAPTSKNRIGSNRKSNVFFMRPMPDWKFSVARARSCSDLAVTLTGREATFREWARGNYTKMDIPEEKCNSSSN